MQRVCNGSAILLALAMEKQRFGVILLALAMQNKVLQSFVSPCQCKTQGRLIQYPRRDLGDGIPYKRGYHDHPIMRKHIYLRREQPCIAHHAGNH